jgi:two-component system, chemotaxis family, CheB/CheR fusion protein
MHQSIIVAVASSAGDLYAVSELLSALPAVCGAAFVIVQHFDPARREVSLAEALAKRTPRSVIVAQDDVVPERDNVYVMGANAVLTIRDGRMRVRSGAAGLLGPSDTLFTSVAEDLGVEAIGVVLSGGGADGAIGIRAIKQAGGVTFAQLPGSARFASMPISAIDTGCVDYVLRPNEIARELSRMSRLRGHPDPTPHRVPLTTA